MRKALAILAIILALVPVIFGVIGREDTPIFTDETPGQLDTIGSFSLIPAQYSFNDYAGHLILRMGGRVREFDGRRAQEEWSWTPGKVADPLNPTSIDAIDFNGDGSLNDVAYISKTKEVTIREGDEESKSDILWIQDFVDNVYSIRSTDFDGNGRVDDLIVAAGQRIYAMKPATNTTYISFPVDVIPHIIAPVDLDNDGKKNDVVIGTWVETVGTGDGTEIQNGLITVYYDNGNRGWSFPDTPLEEKVTYISAYDRDSDGSEDDVIVIFTDVSDPNNPDSDVYIVSSGSQVFFNSNVAGASPADFDGDGKLDDLILLTKTQVSAYSSELKSLQTYSNFDFNTTLEKKTPTKFLGVTSLSFETDAEGENIFDDLAIFTVVGNEDRVIFFKENLAQEEKPTPTPPPTTLPPTTPPPTTPPPNQAPTAKITGISDGTTVREGSTVSLSASASVDPDGSIASYQWLVDDVLRETSEGFTLNTKGLSVGSHVITLKVTDDDGEVGVTSITISLAKANVPPIADAGEDVTVKEGSSVSLSAEGSSDPDGEIETYEWSLDDKVFSLNKTIEKTFSVGVHTLTLRVTDDKGASSTDTVVVTVEKENLPPRADAGKDTVVIEGASVHLSAKGSSDPDGNITSYVWLMPDGKVITKPEFNATFPVGTYKITLNVTDNKGAVGADEMTITVKKRPGALERIRLKYASEIKITLLTLVALVCSAVIFLRSQREKGLY